MNRLLWLLASLLLASASLKAQPVTARDSIFVPEDRNEFEIGGIKVTGNQYSDPNTVIAITGMAVGQKITIPGERIPRALKALWDLRLFTDVGIYVSNQIGDVIMLEVRVKELPRLTRYDFDNIKKSQRDDLTDKVRPFLLKGGIVTDDIKQNAQRTIEAFFVEKGYLDVSVEVKEIEDENLENGVRLVFFVDRNERVKVQNIEFEGNEAVSDRKLRRKMENTKRKAKLFTASKYIKADYEADKESLIAYYNTIGFRDARILGDTLWREADGDLMLRIKVDEGQRYYFRNIAWKGNTIYSNEQLAEVLGIGKGEAYNSELLETRLSFSQDGRDISSLYLDNGYLFFRADPVEKAIIGDSIDLEIRIYEGPQASIDRVMVMGNDRTHEHVVRRELRTKPGKKFSRSDIIRSQREIMALGYFNPESLGIDTPVDPERGTVDIAYTVEERSSDQLELSAGWGGAGQGVIGTLGVTFNNFSMRNILKRESWSPLPMGDGQRLSLRGQTNGRFFQSYNFSFTEPWLGGKKPTSFTLAAFYSLFTNGGERGTSTYQSLGNLGITASLGTRLRWPDDFFISNSAISFQTYGLNNWVRGGFFLDDGTVVAEGNYINLAFRQTFARNSINNPIFPDRGSRIELSVALTPPWSLFDDRNYGDLGVEERFRLLEYHKWRLTAEWFTPVAGKLVFRAAAKIGMLGYYNSEIGVTPFERFELGGDGIANQFVGIAGRDIIALRGYDSGTTDLAANAGGATVFDKLTLELRYPISTNPNSTIYVTSFFEGGNAWDSFRDFNPFDMRRSAGMGLRVFLPMFGTLGFDYAVGFDKDYLGNDAPWTEFGRFNIVLGFEPE